MERARTPEQFQSTRVASFSRGELDIVGIWMAKNVHFVQGDFEKAFKKALETARNDKGEVMDERTKRRLIYAKTAIGTLIAKNQDFKKIQGRVEVWQMTPNGDELEIRLNRIEGEGRNSR